MDQSRTLSIMMRLLLTYFVDVIRFRSVNASRWLLRDVPHIQLATIMGTIHNWLNLTLIE
jgi:hypothetical protein